MPVEINRVLLARVVSNYVTIHFTEIKPNLLYISAFVDVLELVMSEANLRLPHLGTYHVFLTSLGSYHSRSHLLNLGLIRSVNLDNISVPLDSRFTSLLVIFGVYFIVIPDVFGFETLSISFIIIF
jgi:hypothetical protein